MAIYLVKTPVLFTTTVHTSLVFIAFDYNSSVQDMTLETVSFPCTETGYRARSSVAVGYTHRECDQLSLDHIIEQHMSQKKKTNKTTYFSPQW